MLIRFDTHVYIIRCVYTRACAVCIHFICTQYTHSVLHIITIINYTVYCVNIINMVVLLTYRKKEQKRCIKFLDSVQCTGDVCELSLSIQNFNEYSEIYLKLHAKHIKINRKSMNVGRYFITLQQFVYMLYMFFMHQYKNRLLNKTNDKIFLNLIFLLNKFISIEL